MSFFSSLKTLLLTTAIVLCCSTSSFAAPVFLASTTNATITATLNGVSPNDKTFLYYKTTPFDQETLKTAKEVSGSTVLNTTFFSVVVAENTTYYVRAGGIVEGKLYLSPPSTITTGIEIRAEKLVFEEPSSDCKSIYIKGKILTANRKDYEVILKYYNTYEQGTEPHEAKAQHGRGTQANFGIAEDGSYDFYLPNLTTGTTKYFVTQTIRNPKTGAVATEQGEFFSCKGNIAGTTTESDDFNKRSYRFLAPISIPGLGTNLELLLDHDLCLEQAGADAAKQHACNNQIGDFINLILRVLISFAAVFLVVQIIIKGYQYMVTDIPKFKVNAKERVFEAFGGLLLALSSYLILNTINPRLLSGTIGIKTIELSVEDDDNEIITDDRFTQNNTVRTNRNCKGKIIDIKTGNNSFIDVCDEIAPKIELMFSDAKKAGIILSGGGYRTHEEQVTLYNQNCGGGGRKCDPATARPGSSMHETGKAFDLKCEGSLITFSTPYKGTRVAATKKCFDWLSQNAYKYGLSNLKKENWHWSVNGR